MARILVPLVMIISVWPAIALSHGFFSTHALCQGSSVEVSWTFFGDPGGEPQFVGYDVYRQIMPECPPAMRVNVELFPRTPGTTHSHTFIDESIVSGFMYRYEIVPVDENRNPVQLPSPPNFCDPCDRRSWASCPNHTAPLVHGTIVEAWPGTLFVLPCQGTCYEEFLIEEPWPEELNQYVGTNTAVQLFGPYTCGSQEGCWMTVTDFEVVACGATPVEPSTWGAIKASLR